MQSHSDLSRVTIQVKGPNCTAKETLSKLLTNMCTEVQMLSVKVKYLPSAKVSDTCDMCKRKLAVQKNIKLFKLVKTNYGEKFTDIPSVAGQYEARLRILEEHLLSTSDLTKFFKELKPSSCRSSVSSESRILYKNPVLGQALDLLRRGRKEDERGNWSQALVFYDSGLSKL